jgi:DNA-directed RNA polymerase subunit RPC12/RpoP
MLLPGYSEVSSTGEDYVDFQCERCGLEVLAGAKETGKATAFFGQTSGLSAEGDRRLKVLATTRLSACPRCGHRNRWALVQLVVGWMVPGIGIGGVVGIIVANRQASSPSVMETAVGAAAASCVIFTALATAIRLFSVGRKVRFYQRR